MKSILFRCITLMLCVIVFSSCGGKTSRSSPLETVTDEEGNVHSQYYIEGYSQRSIRNYFSEVVLSSEFSKGDGDLSLVQKWEDGIDYYITGNYYGTDVETIESFFAIFEGKEGFPKVRRAENIDSANLIVYFVSDKEFIEATSDTIGDNTASGAATFYYDGKTNEITSGVIYYRKDMADVDRASVILEELYNVMGAPNDTTQRRDSIIYQRSSDNNELSQIDILIMELLYRPEIKAGMDYNEVSEALNKLYF